MTGTPAPSLLDELSAGFDSPADTGAPPSLEAGGDAPPPIAGDTPPGDAPPDAPLLELPALEAPAMWKQQYRDAFGRYATNAEYRELLQHWKEQHGETQKYITQRDQEYADFRKRSEPLWERVKPYEQYWAQQGLSPEQGLGQIMAYAEALANDPASTLFQLAEMYGVDLQQSLAEQPYVDPQVQALQREIAELKQATQGWGQQQQTQQHNRIAQEIQAFQSATDEQGNLKAPHFDRVFDSMLGLARGGMAPNGIQQAYEMAVLLNPEIQAELTQAKTQQEAAQKAAAAKRALGASQTVQGKATSEAPPPAKSLENELKDQLTAAGWT